MDLNSLLQKINNYTTVVSSWVKNVGKLYFSSTPTNVTVDMLDDNGNLTTTTIPNVAMFRKQVWDDVGGALGQLSRIVYLDSINGDDNIADGTESNPYKTLNAIASHTNHKVRNLVIRLKEDYLLTTDVSFSGIPYISISGATQEFRFNVVLISGYNNIKKINLNKNSILEFSVKKIAINEKADTTKGMSGISKNAINLNNGTGTVLFRFADDFEISIGCGYLVAAYDQWAEFAYSHINLVFTGYTSNRIYKVLVNKEVHANITSLTRTVGNISFYNHISIKDFSNNSIQLSDCVAGIVRDLNGVPRNLICNKIL